MEMKVPTITDQSLYGRDLHTMPKTIDIADDLSSCIAPDSSACEQGVFLQPR